MNSDEPWHSPFLRLILWSCWGISAVGIPLLPYGESQERMNRADRRRIRAASWSEDGDQRQSDPSWRLSWEMNRFGGFPTCFVLSTGMLCIVYTLDAIRRRLPAPAASQSPAAGPAPPAAGT